jgi:hypothetical protein
LIFCPFSANLTEDMQPEGLQADLQCHPSLPGVAEHAGPKDAASQPEKAII